MQLSPRLLAVLLVSQVVVLRAHAQQGVIEGTVRSTTNDLIGGAVVALQPFGDSSNLQVVLADSAGRFVLKGVQGGKYRVHVTALNYMPFDQPVDLSHKRTVRLDSIQLASSYESMSDIAIVVHKPELQIKNDTSEFNASSFRVRTNGTVEDLFKKVPGIIVDKSGTVTAQGQTVTQIYVDGKPFMGTDLKTVMENFPADVIDKVQIIDKRSDQALATGVEDGQHTEIINITLKKDRRRGVFGYDYLGGGTDGRYEGKSNTNLFSGDRKLTIVAGGNNDGRNDNNPNGNALNDATYNNWNGVTDYKQLKVNFANKLGKGFDYSLYSGYDQYTTNRYQEIDRQNIFTDSSTYYDERDTSHSVYKNLNGGLYFEFRPDTLNLVRFNETAGYAQSSSVTSTPFSTLDQDSNLVNNGTLLNSNATDNPYLNGQVSFNHRFQGSHRDLFLTFTNNLNDSYTGAYTISNNNFFPLDSTAYSQQINQFQKNPDRNTNLGSSVSYSEPLGGGSALNFSYGYNYGKNDIPQTAWDYNPAGKAYDIINDSLTNHFNDVNYTHNLSLNYNYGSAKTGFGVGLRWLNAGTESTSFTKDSAYRQGFAGFAPNLSFFRNGKGKRFYAYYNFSLQAPQASQLQPVVNNSNPLYLVLGNPDLHYAEVHTVRYVYNYYNSKAETGFNTNATFNDIVDNVSNSISTDAQTGSQSTEPVNLNGAYNWNAWFSYFRPLHLGTDKIKWYVNLYAQGARNVSLLNGDEDVNASNYTKFFLGFTYDTPHWLDLHTDFSVSRQESDYSEEPNLNNVAYFMDVSPNVTFVVAPETEFNIDYDYRQSSGQQAGFNTSVNMLNADFVQYFNPKKDIWLKIKGYDLLNQNVSVWRTTGSNFIQDTRSNVLTRFVLVSLNVRINKFLAPQEPHPDPDSVSPDPGKPTYM